jgi:hypothetical protein
MAIGTTPLFSELSGSCGPVDFRTRRNNKIEIGKKRIPANPQSTEQTNTRNAYGRLHELWQNADWIDKTQYENMAAEYNISTWNAFLKKHLPVMRYAPIAYYGLAETSGIIAHDFSQNNAHCNLSGVSWDVFGPYDLSRLSLDGIDDTFTMENEPLFDLTDMTLLMRIDTATQTGGAGSNRALLQKGDYWDTNMYALYILSTNPNRYTFTTRHNANPQKLIAHSTPETNQILIAATKINGSAHIVVNGSSIVSGMLDNETQHSADPLNCGLDNRIIKAHIAEIAIFDYGLSTEKLTQIHNNTSYLWST